MPMKSVLEIDVNDEKFKEFNALFERSGANVFTSAGAAAYG